MLNTYPLWKYLLVLVVVALGGVYAAPNLYPPDYAVQIAPDDQEVAAVPERIRSLALDALDAADLPPKAIEEEGRNVLLRFPDNNAQVLAKSAIQRALEAERIDGYVVALNLAPTTPPWLTDIGGSPMKYGLDLSGGVHFLLEVDLERAVQDMLGTLESQLKATFREARLRYAGVEVSQDGVLRVGFRDAAARDEAYSLVAREYGQFQVQTDDDVSGNPGLRLTVRPEVLREREDYAISQNLLSLRNRVNELGVSEPLVQRLGRNRIVLDLPGVQDSAAAKRIIGKVANLDFRLVDPDGGADTITMSYEGRPVVMERESIVTGERVSNAQQNFDPETSLPQVSITLDGPGGERMHRKTRNNIGQSMAIIFKETKTRFRLETDAETGEEVRVPVPYQEERLISVATIQAALGNQFRITGLTLNEARDLALLLRAGALAAPMYIVEERTVGASLGEENIERGMTSVVVGFALVLAFMLVYYKVFGLAANIALAVNLVLLIAVMSALGATLTLPGIAGIVLTVGMAVDANVLIFSRIKEELQDRSPQHAIHAGFERAFVTIFDANITTFFVAIILYAIGTGPVKGFAVTLAIGIATSMFTAIMGTRALVNLFYGGRNVKKLLI